MLLDVFIPQPGTHAAEVIKPGSAIVGSRRDNGSPRFSIDYEGDLYGARMTFEDCLVRAAGRHEQRYPTRARLLVTPDEVVRVGSFDTESGRLVESSAALDEWRNQSTT